MCAVINQKGTPELATVARAVFQVYIMNREHLYGGSITYRTVDRGRCPRVFPKLRFYVEISETYFPNWPPLKCLSQNCSRYILFSKIYSLWLRKSSDRSTAAEKQFPVRVLPLSHGNLIMITRWGKTITATCETQQWNAGYVFWEWWCMFPFPSLPLDLWVLFSPNLTGSLWEQRKSQPYKSASTIGSFCKSVMGEALKSFQERDGNILHCRSGCRRSVWWGSRVICGGPVASFHVFPRLAAVLVLQGFKGLSVFCHRESCKLWNKIREINKNWFSLLVITPEEHTEYGVFWRRVLTSFQITQKKSFK